MKRLTITLLVFSLLLVGGLGSAWSAVSLPTANISGGAQTTAGIGTGSLVLVHAFISHVNYLDGTSTTANTTDESIIGMTVTISGATRTGDYTFTDAVLSISDGSFKYLTATLSDISFITNGTSWYLNPSLDVCNQTSHNLSDITLNTDTNHPSRYIDEFQSGLDINNISGMKMTLLVHRGDITGDSFAGISVGLIMGPPPIVEVEVPRSVGYWKNHGQERECFIKDAASDDIDVLDVFSSSSALRYFLNKTGKKSMEDKAKQQLAALLLNISAGLDPLTPLTSSQLELINPDFALIPEGDGIEDTIGDTVIDIENAILTGNDLERVKDLAESINNN